MPKLPLSVNQDAKTASICECGKVANSQEAGGSRMAGWELREDIGKDKSMLGRV